MALPQELRSQLEAAAGSAEETEARLRREAAAAESRARDAEAALAEASASASDSTRPLLRCTCQKPVAAKVLRWNLREKRSRR